MGALSPEGERVRNKSGGTCRVSETEKKKFYFYCQGPVGAKCEIHNRVKVAPSSIPTSSRPIITTTFQIAARGLASRLSESFVGKSPGSESETAGVVGVADISGCTNRQ